MKLMFSLEIEPDNEIQLRDFEVFIGKVILSNALEMHNGSKSKAAKMLGINRTTLIERMRRYKLPMQPYRTNQYFRVKVTTK
jgi:transcriptional regulator with PAS, ATPase and Fis domain